ncbi:arylsulfotransferase ASST [Bradyrhizobium macuxiense]|uniref:Arylsulfotransferase ASST n=1 Tax=Bradyrhizobium macuxiense TaxID=1755647 RepID=A0A560KUM4_9BRAD|nr:arylsulfotransferase family protein [Bradyrhizobium macuxiense]TWB86895.1 arylsulfotransferase ASST [Bradyrhizobium macuxiense]
MRDLVVNHKLADCPRAFYLYSRSSTYPHPTANLVDSLGHHIHQWANTTDQLPAECNPPSFLKGWNHVRVDEQGNLFVIVPLRSLIKLDPFSRVVWKADIPAHHDVEFLHDGGVLTLTEDVVDIELDGQNYTILDNFLVFLDSHGGLKRRVSISALVLNDSGLRELFIAKNHERLPLGRQVWEESRDLEVGRHSRDPETKRGLLSSVRQLTGSPLDVLHANSVMLLKRNRCGMFSEGNILISLRNLDTILVADLRTETVLWSHGADILSGQHQPILLENGRILVFDNGRDRGFSRLVEIDPQSRKITWEYRGDELSSFFSPLAGGCELLANGNILATDAQAGRAFEVTRAGKTVWTLFVNRTPGESRPSRVAVYRVSSVTDNTVQALIAAKGAGRRQVEESA